MFQTGCIKTLEHKPRRGTVANRLRRRIDHGVDESPRGADDWNRAVSLSVELREAAGLEPARHERDVGGRLHEMGEPFVEADDHVDRPWIRGRDLPQGVFLAAATRAQNHEVHAARAREFHDRIKNQFDALLFHKPTNEGRQRPCVGGGVAQAGGKRDAGRILALLDVGIAKAPRQVWISRRIPERRIDAVDDARE